MDFAMRNSGTNNSNDDQELSNGKDSNKKNYHRHTSNQIQILEAFFKECPHPDESQRRQLSRELGLETKQIKFWFQNKRTQTKAQSERADNSILRAENERIQCENLAIREALKNVICPACGGPPFGEEERQRSLQKLQIENAQLKEEHEKLTNLLAKYIGRPVPELETSNMLPTGQVPVSGSASTFSFLPQSFPSQGFVGIPTLEDIDNFTQKYYDNYVNNNLSIHNFTVDPQQSLNSSPVTNIEKALMFEAAASAVDELIRLVRVNESMWIKSQSNGLKQVIHRESYEKIFPRTTRFKSTSSRIESSKESGMVAMRGFQLVEMMLDAEKWMELFPTIVTKAEKLIEIEAGINGSKNGSLMLMYEQMHILSPLVPAREFIFLRHCLQIEAGLWVVVDISYDLKGHKPPARCWKLPSGCMIQEMANGYSKVVWIEHVEVDDKTQTHRLYRDLVCSGFAYGAERWVVTLQRICERLAFSLEESTPQDHHPSSVPTTNVPMGASRKSIMKLCHRMVKDFCSGLCMSVNNKLDFPQISEVNSSGVRVCVREGVGPGQPSGMIVSAASSIWLPLPTIHVFNFFRNENMRDQWDVLCNGNAVNVIAQITNDKNPGNSISILQPYSPTENSMVMLQESFVDNLGGMIVYAPIDVPAMNVAITGESIAMSIPILPSGFVISGDGRPNDIGVVSSNVAESSRRISGSLLTVAFQILVTSSLTTRDLNMESVATVNTLISSTIQRIKSVLCYSDFDN